MIANIQQIKAELGYIHNSLLSYGKCQTMPPIIDSSFEHDYCGEGDAEPDPLDNPLLSNLRDPIPGLRVFRESVKRDMELLDRFVSRHSEINVAPKVPSTNGLYLIAVWNELVRAPPPVLFMDKVFPNPSLFAGNTKAANKQPRRLVGVKVDIVAGGGERWIRVNTTKNSRLLVEFREQDSYLTGSESEEDADEPKLDHTPNHPSAELDNSMLRMGRSLLESAKASVSGEMQPPKIKLRLTRLIPDSASLIELLKLGLTTVNPDLPNQASPDTDPRIGQTLRELLNMGVDVELGELPLQKMTSVDSPLQELKHFHPSRRINVDLSVLLALISDITHAPLPLSPEEARSRYIPTTEEKERARIRREKQKQLLAATKAERAGAKPGKVDNTKSGYSNGGSPERDDESELSFGTSQLARQAIQEMDDGFIEGLRLRLDSTGSLSTDSVELWTTKDARDRCLRIVDKIGGPRERQRVNALFWGSGTRLLLGQDYALIDEAKEAYWGGSRYPPNYLPFVPIRIFVDQVQEPDCFGHGRAPFWFQLERSCRRLLAQGFVDHPRALPDNACQVTSTSAETPEHTEKGATESTDGEIQRAPVMKANPRLTVHTVDTLLCGAVRRWTTLTSNRSSVREILKESVRETMEALKTEDGSSEVAEEGIDVAAIWLVEPRSLAEGMRNDFIPV